MFRLLLLNARFSRNVEASKICNNINGISNPANFHSRNMKSKVLTACKLIKAFRQLVTRNNHRFLKLLVNTSIRLYPKTITESGSLFFRHVIQNVADVIFIKIFSVIRRIQNRTRIKLRLIKFLISSRFNLSDENLVRPMHRRTRITVIKKLILAAFNFHRKSAVSCSDGRVGNLTHFVKVNRHILMSQNAVYLFLVTKTTNPNLASVPQSNQTVVDVSLIIFCSNSFIQPRNQSLMKNRASSILRPEAADQMSASRIATGPEDDSHN